MPSFSKKRAGFIFLVLMTMVFSAFCFAIVWRMPDSDYAAKAWSLFEMMWTWWTGVSVLLLRNMLKKSRQRREEPDVENQLEVDTRL